MAKQNEHIEEYLDAYCGENVIMETAINILHKHRVEVFDERRSMSGGLRFEKMKIKFSDGMLFYDGWIQDLGINSGPTVFPENYDSHDLEYEEAFEHPKFGAIDASIHEAAFRPAMEADLEQIIDLRFHNYFDACYHRISAFQALNHRVADDHLTWVVEIDGQIVGHIYYVLHENGTAYLDDLFVHPDFRGLQFASGLLKLSMDRLREKGMERIELRLIGDEDQCEYAAQLYDRFGFSVLSANEEPGGFVRADMAKDLITGQ